MREVTLEPMTPAQFAEFMAAIFPPYVAERAAADHVSREEAERVARGQFAEILTAGQFTPGHHFQAIHAAGAEQPVGGVWFQIDPDEQQAFLYNITVFSPWRRHGYATAALAAVEQSARAAGCASLALNVFAPNTAAADLYRKLGYSTVSRHMNKTL